MIVQFLSDLHLEFDRDGGRSFVAGIPVYGDVLVLAGDIVPLKSIDTATRVLGWFCERWPRVVFVPGNHEYYGTSPPYAELVLAACSADLGNLHVLDCDLVSIDGARFVGATLWFPESVDRKYERALSDFAVIRKFVPWVYETHEAHLEFLRHTIRPGDVVVTHHLPHPNSVAQQYEGSPLNRFFLAEDAAPLVEQVGAYLWIHGHTHVPCDYVVGETRVACNPRGYPGERVSIDLGRSIAVPARPVGAKNLTFSRA